MTACAGGILEQLLQLFGGPLGRLALPLRHNQALGLEHENHAPVGHHRQRLHGIEQRGDRRLAPVQPIHVEGTQPFVDQFRQEGRQLPLLHLVVTFDEVQGLRLAAGDLLPEGRR